MADNDVRIKKRKRPNSDETEVCKHSCKNKASCRHACCKRPITYYGAFAASPTTCVAIAKVFGTAELVELIFINLDEQYIINAIQVCKGFKDVFDKSLPLKEKMFLSYTEPARHLVWTKETKNDHQFILGEPNPNVITSTYDMSVSEVTEKLLTLPSSPGSMSERKIAPGDSYAAFTIETPMGGHVLPVVLNPLLFKLSSREPHKLICRRNIVKGLAGKIDAEMFLTRPPVKKAWLICGPTVVRFGGPRTHYVEMTDDKGIKMGDVVAAWLKKKEKTSPREWWITVGLYVRNYHVVNGEETLLGE